MSGAGVSEVVNLGALLARGVAAAGAGQDDAALALWARGLSDVEALPDADIRPLFTCLFGVLTALRATIGTDLEPICETLRQAATGDPATLRTAVIDVLRRVPAL